MSEAPEKGSSSKRQLPPERTLIAALLGLIVFGAVVALVVLYTVRVEGSSAGDRAQAMFSDGSAAQAERSEVGSVAKQFVYELNTYGPDDLAEDNTMPAYRERVGELTTPKFTASFEEGATLAEASVAQADVGRSADIFGAGVSALDEDSARVLVGGSFTLSYPDAQGEGEDSRIEVEPETFRFEVTLVKTEGQWLVDDFVPVVSNQGGVPQAPGDPVDPEGGLTPPDSINPGGGTAPEQGGSPDGSGGSGGQQEQAP